MAKWPKDSPGTWYSHYKRGSLVSGPACGARSPGCSLDSLCALQALHGSGSVCTCFLVLLAGWSAWLSTKCDHLQFKNKAGDALQRKWRRGLWVVQAVKQCFILNGGEQIENSALLPHCWNYWLYIHASATLREHLLRVTVRLDTWMTQEAAASQYMEDLIAQTKITPETERTTLQLSSSHIRFL